MSKVKIDLLEGKNTNGKLTLCINDNRVAGIKSGYGYELIKTWNVNKEDLLKIINSSTSHNTDYDFGSKKEPQPKGKDATHPSHNQ